MKSNQIRYTRHRLPAAQVQQNDTNIDTYYRTFQYQGVSQYKDGVLPGMGNPMLKIRRSHRQSYL